MDQETLKQALRTIRHASAQIKQAEAVIRHALKHGIDIDPSDDGAAEPAGRPADEPADEPASNAITAYLQNIGVRINKIRPFTRADMAVLPVACYMGFYYDRVEPLISQIKKHMSGAHRFTMPVRGMSAQQISDICRLGKRLHNLALVQSFLYRKTQPPVVEVVTRNEPFVINFLSGRWMEQYILRCVETVMSRLVWVEDGSDVEFTTLANAQIVLPNGEDFEIDLMVDIQGELWWIESKSGDYQQHIHKYARVCKMLGVRPDRMFLTLSDPPVDTASLSALYDMRVVGMSDFPKAFADSVREVFEVMRADEDGEGEDPPRFWDVNLNSLNSFAAEL